MHTGLFLLQSLLPRIEKTADGAALRHERHADGPPSERTANTVASHKGSVAFSP